MIIEKDGDFIPMRGRDDADLDFSGLGVQPHLTRPIATLSFVFPPLHLAGMAVKVFRKGRFDDAVVLK